MSVGRLTDTALLVVAHGASQNRYSALPAFRHTQRIRRTGIFGHVACGFWKQQPFVREVFEQTLSLPEIKQVIILPLFLAEGYFSQKVIPEALGINPPITIIAGKEILYAAVPGTSLKLADVLIRRAQKISTVCMLDPKELALIVVGHGTERHENTATTLLRLVEVVTKKNIFAECHPAFMEMQPFISNWHNFTSRRYVVVVPFFVANGLHAYEDIPVMLGITEKVDPQLPANRIYNPRGHFVKGRHLWYCPSIGYEPEMTRVLLECAFSAVTACRKTLFNVRGQDA